MGLRCSLSRLSLQLSVCARRQDLRCLCGRIQYKVLALQNPTSQEKQRSRNPKRIQLPVLILALTSVPSVFSFLPQLHTSELLQRILLCLLPVLGVNPVQIPSSAVASLCSSTLSASSWLSQDSGKAKPSSPVLPAGALPVCGRGHRDAGSAAPWQQRPERGLRGGGREGRWQLLLPPPHLPPEQERGAV